MMRAAAAPVFGLVAAGMLGLGLMLPVALAQPSTIATMYDTEMLAARQPSFRRGLTDNLDNVILPVLTAEERARLSGMRLRLELRLPGDEPFGFRAQGGDVVLSTASLTFLDEIATAVAWLQGNGYSQQTVADYMMMLRNWRQVGGAARPPAPREALCIPADALDDKRVERQALQLLNGMGIFVLLHEVGHVLHRHRAGPGVAPALSRAQEAEADRFALDVLARLNEAPLGLAVLFTAMVHFHEVHAAAAGDAAHRELVAGHTHPLSPSRLREVALHVAGSGAGFVGDSRATAEHVARDIRLLAGFLGDLDLQRLIVRIGDTVRPAHLGPRRPGRHLAPHCRAAAPSGLAFDGAFRGTLTMEGTSFDMDLVLAQGSDGRVRGDLSYGAGFARLEGTASGTEVELRWQLPPDHGRVRATIRGDTLAGSWGEGEAATGGGTFVVQRQP